MITISKTPNVRIVKLYVPNRFYNYTFGANIKGESLLVYFIRKK